MQWHHCAPRLRFIHAAGVDCENTFEPHQHKEMTMKFVQPAVLILAMAFAANIALAADPAPAKPLTPQQQKMKDCNLQAADKKGDERKA
jgi:hypothetical protein